MEIEQIKKISGQIEEIGEQRLEELEDIYSRIDSAIKEFEGRPNKYVYRSELIKQLNRAARKIQNSDLSSEEIEAFDLALSFLKKWRFIPAKDALEGIKPTAGLRAKKKELIEDYKRDYHRLSERQRILRNKILRLEGLMDYPDVDEEEISLETERMRNYNSKISEILIDFIGENRSREVIKAGLDALYHPEIRFPRPYDLKSANDLYNFLCSEEIGEEPIYRLLEYYRFSLDRLAHYLKRPIVFKEVVESNVAWLEALKDIGKRETAKISFEEDSSLLNIRISRIISFISKIDRSSKIDSRDVLEYLLSLRKIIASGKYDLIRRSDKLKRRYSIDEIQKIKDGSIGGEVEALKKELDETRKRLEKLPRPGELA